MSLKQNMRGHEEEEQGQQGRKKSKTESLEDPLLTLTQGPDLAATGPSTRASALLSLSDWGSGG